MDFYRSFFGWNAHLSFFLFHFQPRPLALDGGEAMMIQEGICIQLGCVRWSAGCGWNLHFNVGTAISDRLCVCFQK